MTKLKVETLIAAGMLAALGACATPPATPLPPAVPVFFQSWSASLDDHALSAIQTAAKGAAADPTAKVIVTGAADTTGSEAANRYISKTRAQVVADQLVADGVSSERLVIHGVGMVQAPAQNGSTAQYSRRVLIQLSH